MPGALAFAIDAGAPMARMDRERNEALLEVARAHHGAPLRQAAPMHDIGQVGISAAVLETSGRPAGEERAEMNRRAEIRAEILGRLRIPPFQRAAEAPQTDHERRDGSGCSRIVDLPLTP